MKSDEFEALLESIGQMQEHRKGRMQAAKKVSVPATVDVRKVRTNLGMTQREFSQLFGIPERTLKSWESGERQPEGAARILLRMIGRDPLAVLKLAY